MRLMQRSAVLLPQPDGPMKAVMVFLLDRDMRVPNGLELAVMQFLNIAVDNDLG